MEELTSQHHELEIRNATDIIYVLCMEKLRNDSEMHTIHKRFEVNAYYYIINVYNKSHFMYIRIYYIVFIMLTSIVIFF